MPSPTEHTTSDRAMETAGLAIVDRSTELQRCFYRIASWPPPPNWSPWDWRREVVAEGMAAACQAEHEYDPACGASLAAFLASRILARALTRYRREWRFALKMDHRNANSGDPEPATALGAGKLQSPEPSMEAESGSDFLAKAALEQGLASLADRERWLIQECFWKEKSESQLGALLGISHQAVHKRKRAILRALRRLIFKDATL